MSLGRKRLKRLREYYNFRQNMATARLLGRKLRVLESETGRLLGIHDLSEGRIKGPEHVIWYDSRAGSHSQEPHYFTPNNYTEMGIEEMLAAVRDYFQNYLHVPAKILDAIESGELIPTGVPTRIKYAP